MPQFLLFVYIFQPHKKCKMMMMMSIHIHLGIDTLFGRNKCFQDKKYTRLASDMFSADTYHNKMVMMI